MLPRLTRKQREVESVMAVSRALVAIVARSFGESDVPITLQQWRVLVIVQNYGPMTAGELARWMEVHPSNVTRTCDSLVKADLLDRREDPDDRRRTTLSLTGTGESLVKALLEHRRRAIAAILDRFPAGRRGQVAAAMQEFADMAGDHPEHFVSEATHAADARVRP